MGRKIPGKKHRGIKDPIKQQAQRLLRLKSQINAPPADPDDQPIPKSLKRLFGEVESRKARRAPRPPRATMESSNPVGALVRTAGEDARAFSRRISAASRLLLHPPSAYPVEDEEDDVKGTAMAERRERRRRRRERVVATRPPPIAAPAPTPAPTLAPPRQEVVYERVPFGEVAHEPPTLRHTRRAPPAASLLLSSQLGGAAGAEERERARLAAVAAYRALKRARKHTR